MHNVKKRPNLILKSPSVHIARFLKYIRPFFNTMHEKVYVCKWKTNDDRFQNYFGKMESEISSNKDVQSIEKVKVLG